MLAKKKQGISFFIQKQAKSYKTKNTFCGFKI